MENSRERKDALRQRIEQVLKGEKPNFKELSSKTIEDILEEVSIYHQELEYQNLELSRIREELEQSNVHYKELFEDAPLGYVVIDEKDSIIAANRMFATMVGVKSERLNGDIITKYIHPSFQDVFYLFVRQVIKDKVKQNVIIKLLGDGKEHFVKLEGNIEHLPTQKALRIGFLDVTRETINEQQLIESWEKYRAVSEYAYNWEYWQDSQGQLLYISPSCERITGYSRIDFIQNPGLILQIVHPDDSGLYNHYSSLYQNSQYSEVIEFEYRIVKKDGSTCWLGQVGQNIFNESGVNIGVRVSNRDITKQKNAELEIVESENYLKTIIQTTRDGFWVVNKNGFMVDVNEAYLKMTGYSRDEFLSLHINDIDTLETQSETISRIERIIINGNEVFETVQKRKDGGVFDVEVSTTYISNNGGQFVCFCRDITQRKKEEEKIRFQARLLDVVDNAVIATNQNNEVIFWNKSAEKLYGWAENEVLGRNIIELNISEQSTHQVDEILATLMSGKSWSGDFWVKRKDGSEFSAYVADSPIFDSMGNLIGIIGVSHDISERKRLEQKLVLSDRIFNHAIDMLCIAGFDGYFKTLNPSWTRILGWSNEELLSKPWIDFVHPDDRDSTQRVKSVLIDGEEIYQFENRYLCKDGSYRWISWNSYPYPSENIMFGVARDVTYKKIAEEKILNSELRLKEQVEEFVALNEELTQANEELRRLTEELSESNQRNSALLAANPDLMFVYSRDGVFLDFHTQNGQTLILNPQEFLNKKATEILPKFLADLNQTVIDKLFETDEVQTYSYSLEITGETHHFDARMVKYGRDKALAIVRDITDKRKSEEQIRQLASMVDLAPSAIIIHDFDGNPIYTNQRNLDLHGYSKDEWMSLPLSQVDLPKSTDLFRERIDLIKENGEAYFEVEHYKKDGSILPMEIYAKRVNWDGKLVLLSIGTDISERKRYENKLIENEKRFRELYESTPAMLHSINQNGELLSVSNTWLNKLGYSREEVIGKKSIEFLTPESKKMAVEHNLPTFFQKGIMMNTPYQMVAKDGTVIDILMSAIAEKDSKNNFIRSMAVIEDVTERKKAEKALMESEERFRNMFEIHNAVMLLIEPETGMIFQANRAAVEFYGYTKEELCSMSIQDINQLSVYEVESLRLMALKQNKNYFVFPHKLANGELRTVEVHSSPITADGKNYLFSIIHDITERNIFENKLKERDAQLSLALEVAKIGYWKINLENNSVEWFAGHEKLFGIPIEEFKGTLDAVQEIVHPDDREHGVHNLAKALNENVPFDNTYRVVHPDGKIKWLHSYGNLFKDDEGKPQYIFGISQDITKSKEEEIAIRESEEKYRLLFESNKDGIAIFETDINNFPVGFTDANSAMAEMLGYSIDEFLKLNPSQFEQELNHDDLERRISEMLTNGYSEFETKLMNKFGHIIDAFIKSVLIYYSGKTLVYNIVRDISEKKRAENDIKKTLLLLNETQSLAHLGSWEFDLELNKLIWSDEAYRIFGFNPNEIEASYNLFLERVHPEDKELVNSTYLDSIKNNQSEYEIEHRIIRNDTGELRYVIKKCYHERNESGKIVRSIGMVHDITERKNAEKEIIHFRNLMQYIIEHNRSAIAVHDKNYKYVYVSQRYLEEYNLVGKNIIGLHHYDVIPDIPEKWREVHKKALMGIVSSADEDIYYKSDGTVEWTQWECRPWYNAQNEVGGFVVYTEKITERKKNEKAIKESEERVRSILKAAPVGIAISKNRKILDLNGAVSDITGYSRDELVGKNVRLMYPSDEEFERAGKEIYSEIEEKGVGYLETRWIHKSGNIIDVQLTGNLVVPSNINEGVIFIVQDITERKLNARLVQSRLNLLEISNSCSLQELLRQTLTEAENLTNSQIGFYHFIDENKGEVKLNEWSLRTQEEFCKIKDGLSMHYPINAAGIWVDCIKTRKAEVYNNYSIVPNKKGLPKGHAKIQRFLSVPVIRKNMVVAILGIGNKPTDYNSTDIKIITQLADLAWDIAEKKIADEALAYSESQFRLLFNNMTQGFALHEIIQSEKGEVIDYRYLDINPAFESLTGLKRDYVLGKTVLEILPDTEKFWIDIYGKVALKGEDIKFENYSREIGKYFEVNAFSPKRGQFAVIFTDVTQRRLADEKIKLLSKGLEQSPAIVVITDSKGNIEYVNPTFSKITGYSLQEVIGKNPKILKSGNQDAKFYKNLWMTILRGEDWSGEMLNKKKNGIYYWESALISPIKDEDGQILHFIAIKEDITDRKKAEKALMQSETMLKEKNEELTIAWRKADESDKLKTAFLANMSHEIRTPMNAIIGFSEVLLRPNLSQEKYAYFGGIINDACMQLLSVVNDVIDIAKIETNQISLFEDNININETIKRVASIFSRSAEKKKNTFLFELALPDEFAFIRTDETKFSQIINNLISNAIKFTENGEITLGYKIENNKIDCFVRDNGIGISKENHEIIFERFRQVETSDSRKYGGTGLGLSISKAFVELMGGKIWVVSELGKGSEFHFYLPLKTIQSLSIKNNQPKTESYDFSGRTILIAEDEPANFTLIESWFEEEDVNILHVKDGAEAIEFIKSNKDIDLILMDIKMPVMDGIEATQQIRKFNTDIPIVALTAYALAGDKDRCIAAGCNSYLSKPLKRNDLMEIIVKLIGTRPKQK